jgi:hypothetical protein
MLLWRVKFCKLSQLNPQCSIWQKPSWPSCKPRKYQQLRQDLDMDQLDMYAGAVKSYHKQIHQQYEVIQLLYSLRCRLSFHLLQPAQVSSKNNAQDEVLVLTLIKPR